MTPTSFRKAISTFGESLLDNDIINVDLFSVSIEGLPFASPMKRTRTPSSTPEAVQMAAVAATFTFTYSLQSPNSGCTAGVTIIVECEEPKGGCSTIAFNAVLTPSDGATGTVDNPDADCIPVCEGSVTTVLAPDSDQNGYDWSITGGTLIGNPQGEPTAEVEWGSAGQGTISVTITGPGGIEVIQQQCVDIGAAPVAAFTAPTPVCLQTPVQFTSTSTPGVRPFLISATALSSNQVNPAHTFSTLGIHEVVLTVTTPCSTPRGHGLLLSGYVRHGNRSAQREGPTSIASQPSAKGTAPAIGPPPPAREPPMTGW